MKRVFGRPSPAMVVAIVALIAAVGGTAVAGGVLNKKKVNKIINNRAPGLSVASAKTADGLTDPTLQIRAWAYVNQDGTLAAGRNVDVITDGTGRRCIDTPFTPNSAVAIIRSDAGNLSQNIETRVNDPSLCPVGHRDVRVSTQTIGGSDSNAGFALWIN